MNAGDDIFAYVVAAGLRRYLNARLFFMDSDLNGTVSRQCGIRTAKPVRWRIPGLTRLRRRLFRSIADCFVLAGGSLLPTERGVEELLADVYWQKDGRKRIAMGLSVGPFQSARHEEMTAELLATMEYVAFRDSFSYEWAVSRGIKTRLIRAFDLAVLLPELLEQPQTPRQTEKVLGISLLAYQAQNDPALLQADIENARQIACQVKQISKIMSMKVVLLSLCLNPASDDRIMAKAFANAFGSANLECFEHNGDPIRTFEKVRACSHIVSTRLHGGIMAYAAGVPFLQLEYHQKCSDFAETIGLAEHHRLALNFFSPVDFERKLAALVRLDSITSVMDLRSVQERAKLNFPTLDA